SAVSEVSPLRASLAANFLRRSTSANSASSWSLKKSCRWPSATAAKMRPGLAPQSRPETSRLLSMTALTAASLGSDSIDFSLNLLVRHRFAGKRMQFLEHLTQIVARPLAAEFLAQHLCQPRRLQEPFCFSFIQPIVGQVHLNRNA